MKKEELTIKRAKFYVVTIQTKRTQEDGREKTVKEQYAIDAISFTEAEGRTFAAQLGMDVAVKAIAIAPFKEAYLSNKDAAETYYRVRVCELTVNENTGKTDKNHVCILVRAVSAKHAEAIASEAYEDTMIEFKIEGIVETKIVSILYDM